MFSSLVLMFCSLLAYTTVAGVLACRPTLAGRFRILLILLPLAPGLWSAIHLASTLAGRFQDEGTMTIVSGSCLLAALTMLFCAALVAVFTGLLKRSHERERVMSEMAAELEFEEAQTSLVVNSISGVLWRRCPESGRFLSLSPQVDGFLGYTGAEWESHAAFAKERIHPQDLQRVEAARKKALDTGGRYQSEYRFKRKDGTYAVVCEDGVVLPDAAGHKTVCGVMKDITQRHAQSEMQKRLHKQQVAAAHEAGRAEIAKSVLHNIGNVLTSLNVSVKLHVEKISASRASNLGKAVRLMREHEDNLARFFEEHPQGRRLPGYLISVSDHLAAENRQLYLDAMGMVQHIEHMRDVIALQQVHGRAAQVEEAVDLAILFEQALALEGDLLRDRDIVIERNFADMPLLLLPRNLMLQVLVNLLSNARYAVSAAGVKERRIILSILQPLPGSVIMAVQDTGCGISKSNLKRIFTHGFTTRKDGNGFGLHHAALLVEEMGGTLKAQSDGEGCGSSFIVEFPPRFAPPAMAAALRAPPSHSPGASVKLPASAPAS